MCYRGKCLQLGAGSETNVKTPRRSFVTRRETFGCLRSVQVIGLSKNHQHNDRDVDYRVFGITEVGDVNSLSIERERFRNGWRLHIAILKEPLGMAIELDE